MHIIPVIDIRKGVVVHAQAGDRKNYRPLMSPFAASSSTADVLEGLLELYPFDTVYVADLDAIEGTADQKHDLPSLLSKYSQTSFWIDDGVDKLKEACSDFGRGIRQVVGTENLAETGDLRRMAVPPIPDPFVLSLDYFDGVPNGPRALFCSPDLWPRDIIVMTLARVGRHLGPDFDQLRSVVSMAGKTRRVYAAGGVRDIDDVKRLQDLGAHGALIASALHKGKIKPSDLEEIAGF